MHGQNRTGWVMGTIAIAAVLASVAVGFNGYRNTAPLNAGPAARPAAAGERDTDPLAPRLFDGTTPIRVHVAGAVRKPGVYSLPSWARVFDAMKKAGGPTGSANLDGINLADPVRDGEQVRIPFRGRREVSQAHPPAPDPPVVNRYAGGHASGRYPFVGASARAEASAPALAAGPVNVNTATREQLEDLPGIGPTTAAKIVAYREANGPFLQAEDLMNVKGIGEKKFARLRPLIIVQ